MVIFGGGGCFHSDGHFLTFPISSPQVKSQWRISHQCLQTPALMALNFFSAVGIVVANKALFRRADGLSFATSLTGLHFIATALGVRACHAVGVYEIKSLTQAQESVFFVFVFGKGWFSRKLAVSVRLLGLR